MNERVTDPAQLERGELVIVRSQLTNRRTRESYWWERFSVVTDNKVFGKFVQVYTLRIEPMENPERTLDLDKDIVYKVDPDNWPPGPAAIFMRDVTLGRLKLDG